MIHATVSTSDLKKMTNHIIHNVRYAAAVALTKTAEELKTLIVGDLPRTFIIRSRWVPGSIHIQSADKKDAQPTAVVGSIQPFMGPHEVGGERFNRGSNERRGIPLFARHDKRKTTRSSQWPQAIIARNAAKRVRAAKKFRLTGIPPGVRQRGRQRNSYFPIFKPGGGIVIAQRLDKKGLRFRAWYFLKHTIHQPPDWHFKRFQVAAVPILARLIPEWLTKALHH